MRFSSRHRSTKDRVQCRCFLASATHPSLISRSYSYNHSQLPVCNVTVLLTKQTSRFRSGFFIIFWSNHFHQNGLGTPLFNCLSQLSSPFWFRFSSPFSFVCIVPSSSVTAVEKKKHGHEQNHTHVMNRRLYAPRHGVAVAVFIVCSRCRYFDPCVRSYSYSLSNFLSKPHSPLFPSGRNSYSCYVQTRRVRVECTQPVLRLV